MRKLQEVFSWPTTSTPEYLSKGFKQTHPKHLHLSLTIAAAFTAVKLWDQPRHPTSGQRVKKMWFLYTVELFFSVQNQGTLLKEKWKWLEAILLSGLGQCQQDKCHVFSLL